MRIRSVVLGGTMLLALAVGGSAAGARVRTQVNGRGIKPGVYGGLTSQGLQVEFRLEGPRCITNNNPRHPQSWYCVNTIGTLTTIAEHCPSGYTFDAPFIPLYAPPGTVGTIGELTSKNTSTVYVKEEQSGVETAKATFSVTSVSKHGTATGSLTQDERTVDPAGISELCSSGTVPYTVKLT